jgi:ribonuclease HI
LSQYYKIDWRDILEQKLIITTSAACSGNPGIMGIGGIITQESDNNIIHTFSISKGMGTSNEAQYHVVIEALLYLMEAEITPCSILVKSDSHLIICQLLRGLKAEEESFMPLYQCVQVLENQLGCPVEYIWIPESKNLCASALALSAAEMPCALIEGTCINQWEDNENYIPDEEYLKFIPEVNAETGLQINILNSSNVINISCLVSLLTYGVDKFSRAKTKDLLHFIEIRFGYATSDYLVRTLRELNSYYSKIVLRWVARGLKPNLAFIKARLDTEIKEENVR